MRGGLLTSALFTAAPLLPLPSSSANVSRTETVMSIFLILHQTYILTHYTCAQICSTHMCNEHTCMCTHVCVHGTHISGHTYTHPYVHAHRHLCTSPYVHTHPYVRAHRHLCTSPCVHTHTYAHPYVHAHWRLCTSPCVHSTHMHRCT